MIRQRSRYTDEDQLQKTVADFLNNVLPADAIWLHIPNETPAGVAWIKKMIRLGMLPGAFDNLVCYRGQAIFFELKMPGVSPSPNQLQFMQRARKAGCPVRICRSLEEVVDFLEVYIPLEGRLI